MGAEYFEKLHVTIDVTGALSLRRFIGGHQAGEGNSAPFLEKRHAIGGGSDGGEAAALDLDQAFPRELAGDLRPFRGGVLLAHAVGAELVVTFREDFFGA